MNGRRQVVITKISGKRILLYMENEKIYDVLVESTNHDPAVGNIYVGKVQNIVKNISAKIKKKFIKTSLFINIIYISYEFLFHLLLIFHIN